MLILNAIDRISIAQSQIQTEYLIISETLDTTFTKLRLFSQLPDTISQDLISTSVIEHFISRGYADVKIDSIFGNMVFIKKGERYRYRVIFEDITVIEIFDTDVFYGTNKDIEQLIQSELERIRETGYINVKAINTEPEINKDELLITYKLEIIRGKPIRFSGILQSEKSRYRDEYLTRLSGIKKGMVLTASLRSQARNRLLSTELFDQVTEPVIIQDSAKTMLLIDVQAKNPNQFDFILGYAPDINGNNQIVGSGSLLLRELVMEGSELAMAFDRIDRNQSRFELRAGKKWIYNIPMNVGIGIRFYQEDTTFLQRVSEAQLGYDLGFNTLITTKISWEETTSTLENSQLNIDSRSLFNSVGIHYNSLNDRYIPKKGLEVILSVDVGKRENLDIPDSSLIRKNEARSRFMVKVASALSLNSRHILFPRLSAGFTQADYIQNTDLMRFGGTKSMRGYQEDQFWATTFIWSDLEYRYLLDRETYLFGFYATAWYKRSDIMFDEWLQSYGFGLAYKTRLGLLRFTYAKSPNDTFDNAKIHFGITGSL